jgi:hypothetical protein
MGGPGSGNHYHWWRASKKDTVEDCRRIEANRWMREGILKAGICQRGEWVWLRDAKSKKVTASIGYEVDTTTLQPWVRLTYTLKRTGVELDYKIPLVVTRPHFGGQRWWFLCPLLGNSGGCNRRVAVLYLPYYARYFGCRDCHELTYTSCQESGKYDGIYRLIARETGKDLAVVKRLMRRFG